MLIKEKLALHVTRSSVAALFSLATLLLIGCDEDGTRTVTVGDNEPVLELPSKLKNANPNTRALMVPVISFRQIGDREFTLLEQVAPETATSVDSSYPEVVTADAVTIPAELLQSGEYDVRVEWEYPQKEGVAPVELGSVIYEIRGGDDGRASAVVDEENTDISIDKQSNPLGLDNIQLINSLYKGEDAESIDLSSVASERPWDNYQANSDTNTLDFSENSVYIADYVDNIDYDTRIGARWGVNGGLKILAVDGSDLKVQEDFENVQLSAIGSDEAIYLEIMNLNTDANPFDYKVEVVINSSSDMEPSPIDFKEVTSDITVISENGTTTEFDTSDTYAYRLDAQSGRLDYRQIRPTHKPLANEVSVAFYETIQDGYQNKNTFKKVADWAGTVLFGIDTNVSDMQDGPVLELKILSENEGEIEGRQFAECTPFIITAQLSGVDESEAVTYTFTDDYDGDFLPGTVPDFDEGAAENRKNYKLPPAIGSVQYIYTISVEAKISGKSQTEAKTSSVEFTVTDDPNVENVCGES